MPPGAKKRRNARKKKETALHESVPAIIPEQVGSEEVKGEPEKGASLHLDDDDDVEDSPRSGDSEQISSSSTVENHQHPYYRDSIGERAEIGEVSTMEGEGQKSEDTAVVDPKSESLNGDEKFESEKVDSELTEPSKDGKKRYSSSSSSSSSDDESDHEKDKESEKPEISSSVPETDGSEVVEVVEVPIESPGLECFVEGVKEEIAKEEGDFISALANSVESVKEKIIESIQKSDFISSVESTKEEITEGLALPSSTGARQEVEHLAVVLETAKISIGETSKDSEKSEETVTEITLPPPIAQRASWKSCCGLFDVFTGGSR